MTKKSEPYFTAIQINIVTQTMSIEQARSVHEIIRGLIEEEDEKITGLTAVATAQIIVSPTEGLVAQEMPQANVSEAIWQDAGQPFKRVELEFDRDAAKT